MNEYICQDLPSELYRVHYPGSRTTFSTEHGFEAPDTITAFGPDKLNGFKLAVQKHFTWGCRDSLPFISFLIAVTPRTGVARSLAVVIATRKTVGLFIPLVQSTLIATASSNLAT